MKRCGNVVVIVTGGDGGSSRSRALASPAASLTPAVVARRTLIAAVLALLLLAVVLALWKMRVAIFLFFAAIVIAEAMRPGVEALRRGGLPRALGIAIHYLALFAFVAALLWFAIPRGLSQAQRAINDLPETRSEIHEQAGRSHGLRRDVLIGLERRLNNLPTGSELLDSGAELTRKAVEVVVGLFFLLASAAYWIYERERAETLVLSLLPGRRRQKVSETWRLVDLKLGAFVRGQLILTLLVATVLSMTFWAIGMPYWLLLGVFAGIVELVPVLGPLAAGTLAVAVGITVSWHTAVAAGLAVLAVRLLEDYLVMPRLLGNAVGLSPLVILSAVSAAGILLGGFAVLLAIPLAALFMTLIDVLVLNKDPAHEDVPTVIFPAKEA
jgi:predicted PurR-regulated permease PerM